MGRGLERDRALSVFGTDAGIRDVPTRQIIVNRKFIRFINMLKVT